MNEETILLNKVAESGLVTINLEAFYPKEEIAVFDLKDFLFMGLILKEKDFRAAMQATDWENYRNKNVAVTCTADAVIPVWAYMLVAVNLQPLAKNIFVGNEAALIDTLILKNIDAFNVDEFAGKRIVIKGCGDLSIHESAYLAITTKLRPQAKSIMYGEPCSTVPVYKKR